MVRDRFALHQLREHRDIAQFLHSRSTVDRVEVNDSAVPYNFGDWFGVQQYNGYLPGAPWPLIEVHYIPTVRNLLGNRYLVSGAPNDLHTGPVFEGPSGIKVFENPNAFPRAFAVHSTLTVRNEEDLFAIFRNREHELRQVAVLVGEQLDIGPCDAADEIEISHYTPARVQLRANMGCEGLVVVSDAWFPGWKAYVDGAEAHVYRVDGLIRGVVTPPGRHEIVFAYRPAAPYLGCGLLLTGILPLAALHRV